MDLARFDLAVSLRNSGRIQEALGEFHSMAEESRDPDEKSSLMINEVRCYSMMGLVNEAERVLGEIQELASVDVVIRANVDHGSACVAAQGGNHEKTVHQFQRIVEQYSELLQTPEYRDFYEDVLCRRALSLAYLGRYADAFPVFREAASFSSLSAVDQQQVHLYLGYCYVERNEHRLAKEQFLRAIGFGLVNDFEVEARCRVAALLLADRGFAQAKHQLESVLETHPQGVPHISRREIYGQLSRACHYLGEKDNAKRYKKIAENS